MTLRRLAAVLVAVVLCGLASLATAGPAAAHATLTSTDPVEGSVLPEAPASVTLTFNEAVRLTAQEIAVYDAGGQSVASTARASGGEVTVAIADPAAMADGTYVVGWYVVSADGHPVSGSLTFSVGERSADVVAPPAPPESSSVVDGVLGSLHAVAYLGLLLATGLAAFVALVLPRRYAGPVLRRRLRRLIAGAAIAGVLAALLLVPLASVYAQGGELPALFTTFDVTLVSNELLFAAVMLTGLAAVVALTSPSPPGPRRRVALLAAACVAAVSPAVVGHSRAYQPEWLLLAADAGHLLAGAAWFGGLIGLVLSLRALAAKEHLAAETLARFSTVAGGLLLVVAATGTVLAWRILGSWSVFVDTTYGLLLMVKIALALAVALLAAYNRWRLLPRVRLAVGHDDRGQAASTVTRAVSFEAVVLVVLLAVTGFLVNQSPRPAPVEVPSGRTGVQGGQLGELRVLAVMTPQRRGANTVLIQLQDEAGEPVEVARPPVVELRSAEVDLGSVPVTVTDAGTWRAHVLLPRAGEWELQVSVRESRFENPVTTVRFTVDERQEQ